MTVRDLTELTYYANPGTLAYAWTTNRIEIFLKEQARSLESQ